MHRELSLKKLGIRVLDLSYKYKLSHLGSCFTALPIMKYIYAEMKEDDIFILSSGHAGLAYYAILEELYDYVDAEEIFLRCGIHPERDLGNSDCVIPFSTGSLGMGIGAATGFAIAHPDKTIHCLISDGEAAEGVVYEALNFIRNRRLYNLKVHVNANGYSAYDSVITHNLEVTLKTICPLLEVHHSAHYLDFFGLGFLDSQHGHYIILSEEEYNRAKNFLQDS